MFKLIKLPASVPLAQAALAKNCTCWIARSADTDFTQVAVTVVALKGEACDHACEVDAVGAITSLVTDTLEFAAFPAASLIVAVNESKPAANVVALIVPLNKVPVQVAVPNVVAPDLIVTVRFTSLQVPDTEKVAELLARLIQEPLTGDVMAMVGVDVSTTIALEHTELASFPARSMALTLNEYVSPSAPVIACVWVTAFA